MNNTNNNNEMKNNFTLKAGSRIDNASGYVITSKDYSVTILKKLKFNFVIIKVGTKPFTTDFSNLI